MEAKIPFRGGGPDLLQTAALPLPASVERAERTTESVTAHQRAANLVKGKIAGRKVLDIMATHDAAPTL